MCGAGAGAWCGDLHLFTACTGCTFRYMENKLQNNKSHSELLHCNPMCTWICCSQLVEGVTLSGLLSVAVEAFITCRNTTEQFKVYLVPVVAVRCGSLLQPMLVKNHFCIKLNWLFLGSSVVLRKLNHYFVKLSLYLQSIV
ncbi:uncharacterized protein LOC124316574 [Daphnia pulicaria]|uniref:uncharacterized protein LOC124316574 n=1 Tax=Daphnia pulicaria TaxID=35523 RepID=UPI001EEA552D|nr:uncharacterized protein LOC124316574 [Daphnia pulicaria]